MRTKIVEFSNSIHQSKIKPHIIILTETWLPSEKQNSELLLNNYIIYRADRLYTATCTRGDGTLIAVLKNLTSKLLASATSLQESLFVQVKFPNSSLISGSSYITRPTTIQSYLNNANLVTEIYTKYPDSNYILLGDFNLPNISWSNFKPSSYSEMAYQDPLATSAVSSVNSIANLLNLTQLYPVHQSKNYTLDLCFSDSDYLNVLHCDNAMDLIPCDEHHVSAFFEYNDFCFNNHKHFEKFFLYNSIDVDKFNYLISKFDYSFLNIFDFNSCNIDIDLIINKFYSLLYSAIS